MTETRFDDSHGIEDPPPATAPAEKAAHEHRWAASPTGDDPYVHVCTECGETKSENPAA